MDLGLAFNKASGSGKGQRAAHALSRRLTAEGHTVNAIEVGPGLAPATEHSLNGSEALIVVGGDGTVRTMADLASRTDTPIYHYPLGNENLFAREFGMNRRYDTLRGAISAGRTERIDMGACDGTNFVLMVSVGVDANVVHRLAAVRNGPTTHLGYLRHIAGELLHMRIPTITAVADGQTVIDREQGLLIVANSRQYALRLDPAREADMRDGMLDMVFLPHRTRTGVVAWAARIALGRHLRHPDCRTARARHISIATDQSPPRLELDGDAPPAAPDHRANGRGHAVELSVNPGALRVLLPQPRS